MENNYYVYKHTFPNGKVYIGITRQTPEKRWLNGFGYKNQHQIVMYRAIQKYGWENIEHELLHSDITEKEAKDFERYYITEIYHSNNKKYGYNQTNGGDGILGYFHTDEVKERISEKSKEMWADPEFRERMSGKHSGEKNANYGKQLSDEHKAILSECAKARTGNKNGFYGKIHSDATKQKISESRKGKCLGADHHNSKRVECIETGEVFDSASTAAKQYNRTPGTITSACRGVSHTACGYHWRYVG